MWGWLRRRRGRPKRKVRRDSPQRGEACWTDAVPYILGTVSVYGTVTRGNCSICGRYVSGNRYKGTVIPHYSRPRDDPHFDKRVEVSSASGT
jgi:hypothetical protein